MENTSIQDIFNSTQIIETAKTDFLNSTKKKTKGIAIAILAIGSSLTALTIIAASVIVIGIASTAFTLSAFTIIALLISSLFIIIGIVISIAAACSLHRISKKELKPPFPVENKNEEISFETLDFKEIYNAIENICYNVESIIFESTNPDQEDLETFNHFRNYLFNIDKSQLNVDKGFLMRRVFIKFYKFIAYNVNTLETKPLIKILKCLEDIIYPKLLGDYRCVEINNCYSIVFSKLNSSKNYETTDYNFLATKYLETTFSYNNLTFKVISYSIKSPNHLKTLIQEITKSSIIEKNKKFNIIYNTITSYFEKTLNPDKANFSNDLAIKCAISIWELWKENALFTEQENVLEELLTTFIISPLKIHFRKINSLVENTSSNELFKSNLKSLKKPFQHPINEKDFEDLKTKLIELA